MVLLYRLSGLPQGDIDAMSSGRNVRLRAAAMVSRGGTKYKLEAALETQAWPGCRK